MFYLVNLRNMDTLMEDWYRILRSSKPPCYMKIPILLRENRAGPGLLCWAEISTADPLTGSCCPLPTGDVKGQRSIFLSEIVTSRRFAWKMVLLICNDEPGNDFILPLRMIRSKYANGRLRQVTSIPPLPFFTGYQTETALGSRTALAV